uniref:Glyoxalase/bleomycin resistance protein/dioxygenase (GLO1, gloA) n=2 Tax=environmental samples TaxID=68359 RepID=A0A075GBF6_9EURY|nr:glyoxalase/bleomycin resistance protein/dioxygenase (GLO1, gloA) [uncultured marine group II/III euryarchaeote KM3_13_G12]AIF09795.1 glyoxalase/bleomycin resistance protein/dioxygenase (GLO1, gloA) [uncultured marine group II/III euryarchaeote KM3_41_A09]
MVSERLSSPMVKCLDHLNMSASNFQESVEWYSKVFGFELREQGEDEGKPWGILSCGDALLCIYEQPDLVVKDRFEMKDAGLHYLAHFGLRITDSEEWKAIIERENLSILYGGACKFPHSTAWYLKDPTGWEIEVALWDDGAPSFDSVAHTLE